MDRFSALKAFTRVVEAGSFTRAADSLNMPNATLSKTIQQLEAHLGVSLLQRTTRRKTEHHLGINESNAHIAAGEAGLGIVQTFTYSLKPALASGKLVESLSAWRPAPYPFHVVYARHRHVPPRLRVFIDWLAAVFPSAVQE
ncbi:TPA: LysR family transcriptional regulator [Klebsiella quasipneumoniae subsp. similipneumoniae]|nr:LysR family transcriptional regulator [Klebsiella quasipneumoniae subsp. similipneumoniae]